MKLTNIEKDKLKKELLSAMNDNNVDSLLNVFENYLEEHKPTILQWVEKMFDHAKEKEWFETYWAIDVHGTISIPDYRKIYDSDYTHEIEYYPYAKETLQLMTKRDDIKLIMFTSSYPAEIEFYKKEFKKDGIVFDFINKNTDISSAKGSFGFYDEKTYFNVLMDDKAGFKPEVVWKYLYEYFKNTEYRPDPKWSMKTDEKYHKK